MVSSTLIPWSARGCPDHSPRRRRRTRRRKVRLAQQFFDSQIEEVYRVRRSQDHRCVSPSTCPRDDDDIFIRAYQATVGRHGCDLTDYFYSGAEEIQSADDYAKQ